LAANAFRGRGLGVLLAVSLAWGFGTTPCRADILNHSSAEFASNTGAILYIGAGIGLPLLEDGSLGKNRALRTLDSLGTSVLITEGLSHIIHEERPNGSGNDSFPSGHATGVFAVATTESQFHPRQSVLWYTGAALIADSRVTLRKHYTRDVVVGALIGAGVARWELSRPHGLILAPLIDSSTGAFGLMAGGRF